MSLVRVDPQDHMELQEQLALQVDRGLQADQDQLDLLDLQEAQDQADLLVPQVDLEVQVHLVRLVRQVGREQLDLQDRLAVLE